MNSTSIQLGSFSRDSAVSDALKQPAVADSAVPSSSAVRVATTDSRSTAYSFRWVDLLFVGWLAGCIVSVVYFVRGYRKVRQLVRAAKPGDAATAALIESCVKALKMRQQVRVALTPDTQTPLVTGLLRPVILLSPELVTELTPQQLRAVIMHELQHVARGDLWHQRAVTLIHGIYYFHPCLWWATKQLCRLREQACDEATVAALGAGVKITEPAL